MDCFLLPCYHSFSTHWSDYGDLLGKYCDDIGCNYNSIVSRLTEIMFGIAFMQRYGREQREREKRVIPLVSFRMWLPESDFGKVFANLPSLSQDQCRATSKVKAYIKSICVYSQ